MSHFNDSNGWPGWRVQIGTDVKTGKPVYVTSDDLYYHLQVLGAPGAGKTATIEHIIRFLMFLNTEYGFTVIDPHGQLYKRLVATIARYEVHKFRKVHLIDLTDSSWRAALNPIWVPPDLSEYEFNAYIEPQVELTMRAFASAVGGTTPDAMPRYQKYFTTLIYALARKRLAPTHVLPYLFPQNVADRHELLRDIQHQTHQVVAEDIRAMDMRVWREQTESFVNRLVHILRTEGLQEMLGQTTRCLDIRRAMDDGDIVLVNGASEKFGEDSANVLMRLLIRQYFAQAKRRIPDISRPHYLFVDECHELLSEDIAKMLFQTRKFSLHATLIHQDREQARLAGEIVDHALMSGAQSKMLFRGTAIADGIELAGHMEEYTLDQAVPLMVQPKVVGLEDVIRRTGGWSASKSRSTPGCSSTVAYGADGSLISSSETNVGPTESTTEGTHENWAEGDRPVFRDMPGEIVKESTWQYMRAQAYLHQPKYHCYFKPESGTACHVKVLPPGEVYDWRSEIIQSVKDEIKEMDAESGLPQPEARAEIEQSHPRSLFEPIPVEAELIPRRTPEAVLSDQNIDEPKTLKNRLSNWKDKFKGKK